MLTRTIGTALLLLGLCALLPAADWPAFRGAAGDGISSETGFATTWSTTENMRWKVSLPAPSNGSPIVSNGRVFLAYAEEDGRKRSLACYDRARGEQIWVRTVGFDKVVPTHKTNPHGSSTPASDGKRVVVWHSSAGLYCYDFSGKLLWSRDLGEFRHMWGYGGSPVIYKNRVLLNCGPGRRVFVTAIDLDSGATLWEQEEPQDSDQPDARADGNYKGSWTTPVVAQVGDQQQVICSMPTRVNGYDLLTGDIVWTCDGLRGPRGDLAYSSPLVFGDLCVAIGGYQGPAIGVRLGGRGNVTESHRLWRLEKNPQSIGTGVFVDGLVYRVNASAGPLVECLDPATGKIIWRGRRGGAAWASLVMADKLIYATNRDGTTFVFRANPKEYVEVARNELGETCNATPALSDGQIFIRTHENLYCID